MEEVAGSVPQPAGDAQERWLNDALKIAKQEVRRVFVLGIVPYVLDESDLESEANMTVCNLMVKKHQADKDGAFVRTSVRNGLLDLLRRSYGQRDSEDTQVKLSVASEPNEGALDISSLSLYELLRARLDTLYVDPIRLIYYQGDTQTEAAAKLGISQQALSQRLQTAFVLIKKIIFPETCEIIIDSR